MKRYVGISVLALLMILMAILFASCGGDRASSGTAEKSLTSSSIAPMLNVAILNAGGYYFQVHTVLNPGGEVRGQIIMPPGAAGIVTVVILLSGANEVPPKAPAGTGTGTLVVDLATGAVVSVSVSVTGMTSAVTASHIHQAAAGVNGPIVVPIANITAG